MKQRTIQALAFATLFVAASWLLLPVTEPAERNVIDLRYSLRGAYEADTNVVILYFDNDDIAALGGWPLRRNYYALLIDVLDQVGAAAVGIDVFFGERNAEYPQYDQLLATRAARSGKVVFPFYFRQLGAATDGALPSEVRTMVNPGGIVRGSQPQLPLPELVTSAGGIGHANFEDPLGHEVPLLVATEGRAVPAFALELLRVFHGASFADVVIEDGRVVWKGTRGSLSVNLRDDGFARINFPGTLSSFRTYRCVDILRSFELQRMGLAPAGHLSHFEGKIALIGVIAEGRSRLIPSPFTSSFPAVAVHAAVIDNALHGRFLRTTTAVETIATTLVLALLVTLLILWLGSLKGSVATLGVMMFYVVASQVLFNNLHVSLPLMHPLLVALAMVVSTVVIEHKTVRMRVRILEGEKQKAESELRERELRLQLLEQELLEGTARQDERREVELLEEIKRYKRDIKELTTRVTDLVGFDLTEATGGTGAGEYEGIVYEKSGPMAGVIELVEKIAGSEANVLILGESGTGKEVVARAIHNRSARRGKNFVALNCGAIPETLLESELFGHEKGAFTGAIQEKIGRFEYADGGTIFLDEVAETSEAFQVKLLRVVQEGEFERVGSSVNRKVDVRILAAINKDVKELIRAKKFREDLYYRLNVFTIQLPPLRERRSDIPLLVNHFVRSEGGDLAVSSSVIDAFLQYAWPGNVRELESVVQRAVILTKAEGRSLIRQKDIPADLTADLDSRRDLEDQILESLREKKFSQNSISKTAQELGGMNRGTVAEYFRGTCFKYFFESVWNIQRAVEHIAATEEKETRQRVQKKLSEYLSNLVDGVGNGASFDEVKPSLKPKSKNLPQRYHTVLEEIVRAYLEGKWRLGE